MYVCIWVVCVFFCLCVLCFLNKLYILLHYRVNTTSYKFSVVFVPIICYFLLLFCI